MIEHPETYILAGGQGRRLGGSEPKALTRVGGRPLVEHLIGSLAASGLRRFNLVLGAHLDPFVRHFDLSVSQPDAARPYSRVRIADQAVELRLLDTGKGCDTGGRLGRLRPVIQQTILLAWCDGLCDVPPARLIEFHRTHGAPATVLAVRPPARFGRLELSGDRVTRFLEKTTRDEEWINGGWFLLEPEVAARVSGDDCSFERQVLPDLAERDELRAFRHAGFWHCVDTTGDRDQLEYLFQTGSVPQGAVA